MKKKGTSGKSQYQKKLWLYFIINQGYNQEHVKHRWIQGVKNLAFRYKNITLNVARQVNFTQSSGKGLITYLL